MSSNPATAPQNVFKRMVKNDVSKKSVNQIIAEAQQTLSEPEETRDMPELPRQNELSNLEEKEEILIEELLAKLRNTY